MRVLHLGWFSQGNVGDEAYKLAFPVLYPAREHRFADNIYEDDLGWCDEIHIGGGNIIDEHFLGMIERRKIAKPVRLQSVGCTDGAIGADRLARYGRIWIRDAMSRDLLSGAACDLFPDATWVMRPDRDRGEAMWNDLFAAQGTDLYKKRVAVTLNSHLTSMEPDVSGRNFARWHAFAGDMQELIDATSASFAFLPFGRKMPWDDRVANSWIAHRCKWWAKNAVIWDGGWGAQDTLDFLSAADAVISMRLHATIFAAIGGTPFIDITHHDKNRGFLASVGMLDRSVDYWDFSRLATQRLLDDLLGGGHRPRIAAVAAEQRSRLLDYVSTA